MKKRTLQPVFAGILAISMVLCILPLDVGAASSQKIQQQIDALEDVNAAIQAEIDAIQDQFDANADEIQSVVDQKNAIDQEIALLNTQVLTINQQITAYGQLIADTQEQLDAAQVRLDALNEKHKQRIRAMEEGGSVTIWEVLFEANSFTDLLDRINMMEEIAASDRRRLEEMQQVADEILSARQQLEAGKAELEETTRELEASEQILEEKRSQSDAFLHQLLEKQAEFQALLEESESLQDELMLEIAQKEKELKEAKYDEYLAKLAAQGENPPSNAKWLTPVSGFRLTSPFGMRVHPVLGYKRMHNGVDMACAQGTPIYATRAGKVTAASYQAGGAGNYVSINHGDGFASIYMHMTHYVVYVGQSVAAGQLIGYVGSTGISTGPHLHFGISYAGTYVNPLAYIY